MARRVDQALVILASSSPRRAHLLQSAGIPFCVAAATGVDEAFLPGEPAQAAAERLAVRKAEAGRAQHPEAAVVIGADTIVTLDEQILGKPRDPQDAERMLQLLSGREHVVVTGFAVLAQERTYSGTQTTRVKFRELSPAEITRYVATGEPLDKAGAYGIQGKGSLLIEGIEGDYTTVMGLPMPR
ncbi:MAG: septum formation inhibitor Maf, partial [Cyanobacteria bacterium REEB65]|nr:septum formation inhibitor Maf [Cyanobacteria bacterium REEB65]